jgi:hypothetical protein
MGGKMKEKTSLDIFEDLLSALACWKKVSDKDYQTLETIYYKLLGKKQRTAFPEPTGEIK